MEETGEDMCSEVHLGEPVEVKCKGGRAAAWIWDSEGQGEQRLCRMCEGEAETVRSRDPVLMSPY
jgi:hypothetical protein